MRCRAEKRGESGCRGQAEAQEGSRPSLMEGARSLRSSPHRPTTLTRTTLALSRACGLRTIACHRGRLLWMCHRSSALCHTPVPIVLRPHCTTQVLPHWLFKPIRSSLPRVSQSKGRRSSLTVWERGPIQSECGSTSWPSIINESSAGGGAASGGILGSSTRIETLALPEAVAAGGAATGGEGEARVQSVPSEAQQASVSWAAARS